MSNQTNDDYDMNLSWSDDPNDVPSLKTESDDFAGEMSDGVVTDTVEDKATELSLESIAGEVKTSNEDEDDDEKKTATFGLFKTFSMMVIALAVLIFVSTAWFVMSRDTGTDGMGVKVLAERYEISSPDRAVNGKYYSRYHEKIREHEDGSILVWQVTSGSNFNNHPSATEETDGIRPGTSGKITFVVTPKVDAVDISFCFEAIGYKEITTSESPYYDVVEITSPATKALLNGHILLFDNYDPVTEQYSDLIPADEFGKRVLSNKRYVTKDQEYTEDIYWIWPANLSDLVYIENGGSPLYTICEHPSTDYTNLVTNLVTYPQYYLSGVSGSVTEAAIQQDYSSYGSCYDQADNDIGAGVEYVLLRMSTLN